MANLFVDHVHRWLALAETDADYPIHFIRAWIPFNAWYCNTYPEKKNVDRPIIDALKDDDNHFRVRIVALIQGNDEDAIYFKQSLTSLHSALERFYIPNIQKRISFTKLYFRQNPLTISTSSYRRHIIKAELIRVEESGSTRTKVTANVVHSHTRVTKYRYTPYKYDREHFIQDAQNANLNDNIYQRLYTCYDEINPRKKESIIMPNSRNALNINGVFFINDAELISKALIELLYNLRCILFHGEVQPNRDNLSVYEHAYQMLRILLKSLR